MMRAPDPSAYPLTLADEGATVRIVAIRGSAAMARRIAEIGLNVGSEIAVRQREGGGAVVVSRGTARFALGTGMAHNILVARIDAAGEAAEESGQT